MKCGIFCISIDFELLWGRKDLPNFKYFEDRIPQERKVIDNLLSLFSKYNIPATWAIVGKIFEKDNPNYSGLDIIRKIGKVKDQEIGSHSYTHPEFTKISKKGALLEFNNFKQNSFVFPRNNINYLRELKKAGFKSYRGADDNEYELLVPRFPPVHNLKFKSGLLNIQGSMYFVSGRGLKKYIPKGLRFLKSKLGIDNAIKQNKVFHLWFHPIDFVDDSQKLFSDFERILKYASEKRSIGKLKILNMGQISNKLLT
ncbi:MAG: polysaccharide deacetylase family protein [Patescibacteria group bacterium]